MRKQRIYYTGDIIEYAYLDKEKAILNSEGGESIHEVKCSGLADFIANSESTIDDLRGDLALKVAEVERLPTISRYKKGVCEERIHVGGIYFGYVDGDWIASDDQSLSKKCYELGLKGE